MIFVAFAIGVGAGLAATLLNAGVHYLFDLSTSGADQAQINYRYLWIPLVGICLTSIYQNVITRDNVARGTYQIKVRMLNGKWKITPFTIFNPLVGCSLTVGLGASSGTEGPVALSSAALGSNIGRWCGFSAPWVRIMAGVGAAAGIAAIFKAPVAGVLYALEVLQMSISTFPLVGLIIACVTAATTVYLLTDMSFDIPFSNAMHFDVSLIGWVILFGLFCGFYSMYYNYTKMRAFHYFSGIKSKVAAAVATGLLLSAGAFLFPALFSTGGVTIDAILNGDPFSYTSGGLFSGQGSGMRWMLLGAVGVLLLKGVLVAASHSGGGVSGEFVPTLFAGCVAGWLFASGLNYFTGTHLPVWFFALLGMAAVMAGSIHAPVMAFFVLVETTDTYSFMVSYFAVIIVAYATVKILTPTKYFDNGLSDLLALKLQKNVPGMYGPDNLPSEKEPAAAEAGIDNADQKRK